MSEEKKKVKVKATVYWCQHTKINDMSGKFQVNLCNLSDSAAAALEDMGLSVQEGEEKKAHMGKYVTCKSPNPLRVFDAEGQAITDAVGNGSKGTALVTWYPWTYKNKKGLSPSLIKLVITDFVEYAAGSSLSEDDEDVL